MDDRKKKTEAIAFTNDNGGHILKKNNCEVSHGDPVLEGEDLIFGGFPSTQPQESNYSGTGQQLRSAWSAENVAQKIEETGLNIIAKKFREENISGAILDTITEEKLIAMGVDKIGDRLKISKFIYETSEEHQRQGTNFTAAQQFQGNSHKSKAMGPISTYSSMSGTCTSPSLGNLNDDNSNRDSENESTTGKVDEKKRKTRPKRRKTLERSPRLTVLSYDEEEGELECRLELYNENTVTFKFATAYDKPEEIAERLVSKEILPGQQSIMVITLLREVIKMVTEDPKNAVSQCLTYVSTPSSSPQTVRKSRPVFGSDSSKNISTTLLRGHTGLGFSIAGGRGSSPFKGNAQETNLQQLNITAAQQFQGNSQKSKSIGPISTYSSMSGICTSLSLGNLNDDHLNRQSENESTTKNVEEKKRKTRPKRRKTLERSPRLTVLSYDEEEGELECRLELYNKNTVTFKFATAYDKPEEIAERLVSEEILPGQQSIMVITLLREVINMVTEDPKNVVSQSLSYVSTQSSSSQTVRKSRPVFGSDSSKGTNLEQLNITATQQFQGNSKKSESMGPISASSSMSGICTSLSLENLNDDYSNRDSENESITGKVDEKKRKTRPKRRKTLERYPRLTVLSYDEEEGELECRLELYNECTVTFKFATAYDKPEEIAEVLVSDELLPGQQSFMVITLLREVINMVTEDPKNAVSQCLSYVSTPSSSPQTVRKNRPVFDSDISKKMSVLTKLSQLNKEDFKDLMAKGTFDSYENIVYLAGPCNIGKSSLASILIDEEIPKKWISTDGLVIHFGRNGIDLKSKKMVPLKKGGGDILSKVLLGNPEIKEHEKQADTLQNTQDNDGKKDKVKDVPLIDSTENDNKSTNPSRIDQLPTQQLQQKTNKTSQQISSDGQQQMQATPKPDTLKLEQKQKPTIQEYILDKMNKGSYTMNIAPSDLIDFGGQKSFDMTHQLFIQHRGTFVLMFDGRKGLDTKLEEYPQGAITAASILEHWITSVLTYCNKSDDKMPRILFAATHSDSFEEDEKEKLAHLFTQKLTKMFSSHKLCEHIVYDKVFFINATDQSDVVIDHLKDTLVDIACKQSTWGQQIPIVWLPLDLQISDMRANGGVVITKEKLLEINKSNEDYALSERRVEDFLLVQHSIGKLLYFDELALRHFIVIQPTAMVNILRAFITDRTFWPKEGPILDILVNLSSTGLLRKTDLFTLWAQPDFKDILTDLRAKEYVVQVLLHLDILVEPKRYTENELSSDIFLVPCIVKEKIPPNMLNKATDRRTICIAYQLKATVVPSALSFKLIHVIGASITIWPLKKVDTRYCLYLQAAIMDADNKNELQIHVDGHTIIVYLINEDSKQLISPDLATITQECLTLALERILQFYHNSCFGKQSLQVMSDLFEIEVGEVCNGETCLIPLSDAKQKKHWTCKNGHKHETKWAMYWVFDKNKEQCDPKCKGLERGTLLLRPNDQHLVQLARTIGISDFHKFFISLGMREADYDSINYRYFSNPIDFMLFGLFAWRERTESRKSKATFEMLLKALTVIKEPHYLCQVYREDHTLVENAHSRLQDLPSDYVINTLTENKLIGDSVVLLGAELGLSYNDIKDTLYNSPRKLEAQIHDLLIKWKTCNKPNMVTPTIYRLMKALQRIEAADGLAFVMNAYGVEQNYKLPHSSENIPRSNVYTESSSKIQTASVSTKAPMRMSSEQQNYVRMSMIVLEVLSGVLYDRLYIDTKTGEILNRDKLDITEMCKKYCALNINFPSKGYRKIGKVDEISTNEDTIGDDIQRIRVIRNEMQHSTVFALDDTRYTTLITIVHDMLTRFDLRNNPAGESYVKRLDEIRKMELETRSFEEIKERMKAGFIEKIHEVFDRVVSDALNDIC